MGWFDEQIRQRIQSDNEVLSDSFTAIAGAVTGKRTAATGNSQLVQNAADEILHFYHAKPMELPQGIQDLNEQLEYLMRPYGIMRRRVTLEPGWHKDAVGALLTTRTDTASVVALIPVGFSGYRFLDEKTGRHRRVRRKNQTLFSREAISFYKPLPLRSLGLASLIRYMTENLSISDFMAVGVCTLLVSLVGLLSPALTNLLFSKVVESGSIHLLLSIAVAMVSVSLSSLLIGAVKSLLTERIGTKTSISVQSASMMRVLSLPASFFKEYSAGELSSRVQQINGLCRMLISAVLSIGLTSLFSLIYLSQIFVYAPALVAPALLIILATVLFSAITTVVQMNISKKQMNLNAKESGMNYALISGIQKIRLAGAEKRAFARWGKLFARQAEFSYHPPTFIKINAVISTAISMAGTIVMYYAAVKSGVLVAEYYAFSTAYGMVFGAFLSLAGIAQSIAQIKPSLDMVKPILQAVPEVSQGKQVVTRLSGGIELNNVSFRYSENMPLVLDNLTLKIRPGEYVAIVGKTGCGKSTLMRLMLGFEIPQKGAVYYDGRDLNTIDLESLRRKIGVVLQNGRLFQGDIYSNIVISAPSLTLDDAWEAAELAGIAEDIRRMPMGMHTIISEGSGGVSGGQCQRLMIARAIAPKPRILMFDEATSALDNITQKTVSESLDGLKCTRIVIAHRLSTIRRCDRILVLDQGRILEDGTYDELIAKNGSFAQLVARQQIESPEE